MANKNGASNVEQNKIIARRDHPNQPKEDQLILVRDIKKVTSQAIHTTLGEVLKFRDGYYEPPLNWH